MAAILGVVLGVVLLGGGSFLWARWGRTPARGSTAAPPAPQLPAPEPRAEALPPKQLAGLLKQVSDADIEREIRSGRVFNAVRLYREQTGADAQEAKSAVEAWRNRLTAS
jgi:hypothetical protein